MKNSGLYKGCLEPMVLQLLQDGRMYGYEITQKVKEISRGELNITEGALYPLLHRLEADNLIEAETEHIGSRVRKYYKLTRHGKKQAKLSFTELQQFMETMQLFMKFKTA
jgi:DNA-binding PadR family transcriptional regulator